jgi:hypothetical protein
MRFGIEIEVARIDQSTARRALIAAGIAVDTTINYSHQTIAQWKVVCDTSIKPFGCEVVSPPLEYNQHNLELLITVLAALRTAGGQVNKTTGLHVHVEVSQESSETIANVYNRYRAFERQIDLFHAPSRRGSVNIYCLSLPAYSARPCTRYLKVNLQSFVKYGTIEFRQHAGSLNPNKVINWVKFVVQFVEASRSTPSLPREIPTATSGKSGSITSLLSSAPMTASELAAMLNSNVLSVQSMICRLKKAGVEIRKNGKMYFCPTTRTVETPQVDSWSRGISRSVICHLQARSAA